MFAMNHLCSIVPAKIWFQKVKLKVGNYRFNNVRDSFSK